MARAGNPLSEWGLLIYQGEEDGIVPQILRIVRSSADQ
jgi:hypothetical protein